MKRKRMILMVMLMKMVSMISMISMISMMFFKPWYGPPCVLLLLSVYCYCWYSQLPEPFASTLPELTLDAGFPLPATRLSAVVAPAPLLLCCRSYAGACCRSLQDSSSELKMGTVASALWP